MQYETIERLGQRVVVQQQNAIFMQQPPLLLERPSATLFNNRELRPLQMVEAAEIEPVDAKSGNASAKAMAIKSMLSTAISFCRKPCGSLIPASSWKHSRRP